MILVCRILGHRWVYAEWALDWPFRFKVMAAGAECKRCGTKVAA